MKHCANPKQIQSRFLFSYSPERWEAALDDEAMMALRSDPWTQRLQEVGLGQQ